MQCKMADDDIILTYEAQADITSDPRSSRLRDVGKL